jgi:two-component system, chemotaxis family, chemotaxis protein CheY
MGNGEGSWVIMETISANAEISVMIVDDSLFMRNMLRTMLETSGYTVIAEAVDGIEALAKYQELRPRLTFMDITMPLKSGIEATKEILALDKNAKVVMCSSIGHEDLIRAALETGARDVVFKPYKNEQLHEVLQRIMQY